MESWEQAWYTRRGVAYWLLHLRLVRQWNRDHASGSLFYRSNYPVTTTAPGVKLNTIWPALITAGCTDEQTNVFMYALLALHGIQRPSGFN